MVPGDNDHTSPVPPFVVWTLQRTGGTNLTQKLMFKSGLKPREHEPFNKKRELGDITRAFLKKQDRHALWHAIEEVCSEPRPIKHCLEQVPWDISEALATCATQAGYRHLFLYRKNPLARLLSVEYAKRTGVWGPRHLDKASNDAEAFKKPLDVPALVAHEQRCNQLLHHAWDTLTANGAAPVALAYEDAYSEDEEFARRCLLDVIAYLGLSTSTRRDQKLVDAVRDRGHQGTRDRYDNFQGRDALGRELETIALFSQHPDVVAQKFSTEKLSEYN